MFNAPRIEFGFVSLVGFAIAALPMGLKATPNVDARYIVAGRVLEEKPPAPAHFRLVVVSASNQEGPKAGQVIDVHFLDNPPAGPPVGELIQVHLLGERDGVFIVCPGTSWRKVVQETAGAPPAVLPPMNLLLLVPWVIAAGIAALTICFLFVWLRPVRRVRS